MRIVLGVSAGIAAYKAVHLARLLIKDGHQVDVIPTPASLEFVGRATWEAISGRPVSTSVFEGVDEVRHVALGQQADLVVVAPATADFLARVRAGMANDQLTTTLLATEAPVLLVPAMHTEMWRHAATQDNVRTLRERGVDVMEPADGRLTGPDSGPGRLPEPEQIAQRVKTMLSGAPEAGYAYAPGTGTLYSVESADSTASGTGQPALAGRRVVITSGGTREPLDPVRYLGNRSSGKQGLALALSAAAAGAQVTLITGITEVDYPTPWPALIHRVEIETASQLQQAVQEHAAEADVLIMAAAVADFRPAEYAGAKIKKTDDGVNPVITLERNPDILAEAVRRRHHSAGPRVIVGFAAETGDAETDPLTLAEQKLLRKGCELLVLNDVSSGQVFGHDQTEITILSSYGAQAVLGDAAPVQVRGTKDQAAQAVVARVAELLRASESS